MRFEARELKGYAEHVLTEELREGETYFSITYIDEKLLVLALESLVFIGRNLGNEDGDRLYFQDIHSYSAGDRYGDAEPSDRMQVTACREGHIKYIFHFEHALEQLMTCSLRRRDAEFGGQYA